MMNDMEKTNASIQIRLGNERGHAQHGWLDSYHTFSFGDYYDPKYLGFRSLRVINEDRVAPHEGFGAHPHKDMEILSYVMAGALKHKDSMGHESTIHPGDVQKITAGSGITHSEFNASSKENVHFLQIWIVPQKTGLKPSYQQFTLPGGKSTTPLLLVGSPEGGKNVVQFHQDVYVFKGVLDSGVDCQYPIKPGRGIWIQMVKGEIDLNTRILSAGDGASVENLSTITMLAKKDSEFLLFDLK